MSEEIEDVPVREGETFEMGDPVFSDSLPHDVSEDGPQDVPGPETVEVPDVPTEHEVRSARWERGVVEDVAALRAVYDDAPVGALIICRNEIAVLQVQEWAWADGKRVTPVVRDGNKLQRLNVIAQWKVAKYQ